MRPLDSLQPVVVWKDGHIEIIDQTALPDSLEVMELRTVADVVSAIRRLAVRGAPAIGACGGLGMVVALDERDPGSDARASVTKAAAVIGSARPTAVNLSWAVNRVREAALAGDDEGIRERALAEALSIIEEDQEACRRIGEHGRLELAGRTRVLTHCNTGRLATMGWGTALGVVYAKAEAGEPVSVLACETRPLLQGARLTAWELVEAGIDVTLIPDGAAAAALSGGMVDVVVVGADRIAANGDTANKIGTLSHAVNASAVGIPFYVAAPSSTIDLATATGGDVEIEVRDGAEVRGWRGHVAAPAGTGVWNPAFDITPHRLITAFITEMGVVRPPYDETLARAASESTGR